MRAVVGVLAALALFVAVAAVSLGGRSPAPLTGTGRRAPCPAVFFAVAGSGQGPRFPVPSDVPRGVSRRDARDYGPLLAELKAALTGVAGTGLAAASAIDYPAATAAHWLGVRGLSGLDASEATGARVLVAAIQRSYRRGCAARPVLLAGYSQGAEVVSLAVRALRPVQRRSVTVALFGNPSFEPGRPGNVPAGSSAAGIRPTFLDGSAEQLPSDVRDRTIDLCAPQDPICGVPHSLAGMVGEAAYVFDHLAVHASAYLAGRWVERAAHFLWRHRVPMR